MENNTLTAKEWLKKEDPNWMWANNIDWTVYMEQYANYKNKALEDKIKEFREKLRDASFYKAEGSEYWYEIYNKHFNIK